MTELPKINGYTIDVKLKEFRKTSEQRIEFIEFESDKGIKLLKKVPITILKTIEW